MEKIVASLLEAERLNSRHAKLNRSRANIGALIDELIDDFFDRDRDRIVVHRSDASIMVDVDEARVSLMLKNLVSNALQYSKAEDGPVELSYTIDDNNLILRVRDHGPGIDEELAARLGEPFYRSDPSRARSSGGTGLGLYLATLVAKAHGGKLALNRSKEPGADFEIRLPIT